MPTQHDGIFFIELPRLEINLEYTKIDIKIQKATETNCTKKYLHSNESDD